MNTHKEILVVRWILATNGSNVVTARKGAINHKCHLSMPIPYPDPALTGLNQDSPNWARLDISHSDFNRYIAMQNMAYI
jgi:hypothetical protein